MARALSRGDPLKISYGGEREREGDLEMEGECLEAGVER